MSLDGSEIRLQGNPISAGIAIGQAYVYARPTNKVAQFSLTDEQVQPEIEYYRAALEISRAGILELQKRLHREGAVEGAAILEAHLYILQDSALTSQIEEKISTLKMNSAYLFHEAIRAHEEQLLGLEDVYFR